MCIAQFFWYFFALDFYFFEKILCECLRCRGKIHAINVFKIDILLVGLQGVSDFSSCLPVTILRLLFVVDFKGIL